MFGNTADMTYTAVWTGSGSDGTFAGQACGDWAAGSPEVGYVGDMNAVDATWSQVVNPQDCDIPAHLYCFEVNP